MELAVATANISLGATANISLEVRRLTRPNKEAEGFNPPGLGLERHVKPPPAKIFVTVQAKFCAELLSETKSKDKKQLVLTEILRQKRVKASFFSLKWKPLPLTLLL